jgi:hypothetical protein
MLAEKKESEWIDVLFCALRNLGILLRARDKKHIPRPTSNLCAIYVFDLRSITELVAVLVSLFRFFIFEIDGCKTKLS